VDVEINELLAGLVRSRAQRSYPISGAVQEGWE
jgi:hypothetical protein